MGSGRAATTPSMARINSETNLAVQLLLAVSDSRVTKQMHQSAPSSRSERSLSSSDPPAQEHSSDSDVTDPATSAMASPAVGQKLIPASTRPYSSPSLPSTQQQHHLHHHGRPAASSDSVLFKYNREERLQALKRFRDKKRRRQFQKRVRYMVRKRLAETRPRYKGRFSKPPPGENYDDGTPGPPAQTHPQSLQSKPVSAKQ